MNPGRILCRFLVGIDSPEIYKLNSNSEVVRKKKRSRCIYTH